MWWLLAHLEGELTAWMDGAQPGEFTRRREPLSQHFAGSDEERTHQMIEVILVGDPEHLSDLDFEIGREDVDRLTGVEAGRTAVVEG